MGRNLIETIMGGIVLVVAGYFLVFAYSQADLNEIDGYEVTAEFTSIGSIGTGADVRINGIKVGSVLRQSLDPKSFNAVLTLGIASEIRLPENTSAAIASSGLIGDAYVRLQPGDSKGAIPQGGKIARTVSYKSIEETVGELIFLATDQGGGAKPAPGGPAPGPALGSGLAPEGRNAP
jgi:phospholipid/cholesterol/gamma-HCH transport system substrate-binding protein